MTLQALHIGQSAVIRAVGGKGALRRRLLDMGVIPGVRLTLVKRAPMGDPLELRLHGYELTLRAGDAGHIEVEPVQGSAPCAPTATGTGCAARFAGPPLPAHARLTLALAGNPNCGKTTLFNRLTGANQHAGNFPGVTVERKDGSIRGHAGALLVDLPGIYSLSPYSGEETVTRRFLLEERPDGIISIADATSLGHSLALTLQLMELDVPVVLALNMMDEMRQSGGAVNAEAMEAALGIPVVPICAASGEGTDELIIRALSAARLRALPGRTDFCAGDSEGEAVRRCLRDTARLIENRAAQAGVPVRFAAAKLAEGDSLIAAQLRLSPEEAQQIERITERMEAERGLDRAAAIADMRFGFIGRVRLDAVTEPGPSPGRERSRRIDRVLTGRFTAFPAFAALMALVFCLTFSLVGARLSDALETAVACLAARTDGLLAAAGVSDALRSLIADGLFGGVGSVLSFLPFIVTLFFFLSMLEDSGYMARVAFIMDRPLRGLGLSGRSIVPLLVGFGCTVPGVMAARALPSERDRRLTILLTPFMSCSAKLPVYALLCAAFFPDRAAWAMAALYALGIAAGALTAVLLRGTLLRGEPTPLVMELPNYRMPGLRSVAMLLWEKSRDFLERAFTVILAATIAVWFLQTFDVRLHRVCTPQDSLLAAAAGALAPAFAPLGLGDWRICTALITGFLAKESVVSTLILLFGTVGALRAALTPLSAASLLVFCLLYTPCAAAVAAIRRELGGRWALAVVAGQCAAAYAAALAVRLIGLALGLS